MKRHFLNKQLYLEKIKVLFFQFLFNREVQHSQNINQVLLNKYCQL
jgi:hypothetical protein